MAERWTALTGQFLYRALEDEILVYCHASGATHRFGGAEAWVFEQLLSGPATTEAFAEAARELTEPPPNQTLNEAIGNILAMFEQFGLAAREA
jgi:hypothetical protein